MRAEVRYKNKAVYSSQTREWMYGLYSTTLKVNWIKADVRRNHTSLAHFIWFYASVIIMLFVGPHIFATMSRMMPLFNAINAQKIFWEFHILYVSIYEYIYIHICSFVFPEACSASHIFLPCATKLLVTKMNSTPKKSFIVALHSWLLYEAGP